MSFISYAQNFEDVMLWRALKHISEGFYIDVGANDPSFDSVTRAFYERGWHGINIEPLPSHAADLRAQRERDIILQCAAGAESGEIMLWECDVRGWATASQEVVVQHAAGGHEGMFHKVPVRRLAEICEEFVSGEIHFLKIDVEGFEASVIRGMDFSRFRPWVLVIEATKPNSTTEAHDEWESIVLGAGYLLAYCDGLNRFYVANEHSELLDALRYPPNNFDGFIRSEQLSSELHAQRAEARATQAESKAQQSEIRIAGLLNSTSWRITAPLRWVVATLRRVLAYRRAIPTRIKALIRTLLAHAILYVRLRPRLSKVALAIINRVPTLKQRIKRIGNANHQSTPSIPVALIHLTPRARRIYADLKSSIEKNRDAR